MRTCVNIALCVVLTITGTACAQSATAPQETPAPTAAARPPQPRVPVRDPNAPGFVKATELPDGAIPPSNKDGNFIIGPTHNRAPEFEVQENVPHGTLYEFTMSSVDSKFYPGIARDAADPKDPTMEVRTSHPAPYTRHVAVYVPRQYVPGTAAPFLVGADGVDHAWPVLFDNMIAAHRLPVMIGVFISPGGGDAHGSERNLEYDTMSGKYAEFVEAEVLPLVEKNYNVKLTRDPDGRATMGASSGGSAAMAMAWYHPELYHRVLTVSGTFVDNQYPQDDAVPHGAWELHEHLIPNNPAKPLRIWMEVGDHDNYHPSAPDDTMHDWVAANENMAKVLTAKGYHYQFVFARNAGHTDRPTRAQLLPEALEYIWKGYPIAGAKN